MLTQRTSFSRFLLVLVTIVSVGALVACSNRSGQSAPSGSSAKSAPVSTNGQPNGNPSSKVPVGEESDYPAVNSISDLVRSADTIVVAQALQVTDRDRDVGGGTTSVDSDVTLHLERTIKGTAPDPLTVIQVRGHRFAGQLSLAPAARIMEPNHRYVLFLRQLPDSTFAGVSEPFKFELTNGTAEPHSGEPQGLSVVSEQALFSQVATALTAAPPTAAVPAIPPIKIGQSVNLESILGAGNIVSVQIKSANGTAFSEDPTTIQTINSELAHDSMAQAPLEGVSKLPHVIFGLRQAVFGVNAIGFDYDSSTGTLSRPEGSITVTSSLRAVLDSLIQSAR